MGHSAHDFDTELRDSGEFESIVWPGIDGIGQIFADLIFIDIDSR